MKARHEQYAVVFALAVLSMFVSALPALAALPAEATTAFTTITTYVTDILAAIWPVVALVTGGFILVKLFKKGANKAT